MAFSFTVEVLNMIMMKRSNKHMVELNEPQINEADNINVD
jgi:hypothetical protein